MHTITNGGDYYLVANDFVPYLEAQVRACVQCAVLRPKTLCPAYKQVHARVQHSAWTQHPVISSRAALPCPAQS